MFNASGDPISVGVGLGLGVVVADFLDSQGVCFVGVAWPGGEQECDRETAEAVEWFK